MKKLTAFTASLTAFVLSSRAAPPDHVVIVIEENHAFTQVIGSPQAPYFNSLAAAGASLTNMFGITHPSQPSYVQFFSGANQGVIDNTVPAAGTPFTTPNLGAEIIAAGRTFAGYCEGLPSIGSEAGIVGAYFRKHNPWVNWQNSPVGVNQLAATTNLPFTSFPTDYSLLPTLSIVVPDINNDMHDGTIAQANDWLETHIAPFANWAMTHNSLLIITWDEDESLSRNRIPTIFYGPMVRQGQVASTWTLHNLLRTVEDLYGTTHAGAAAQCSSIIGAFSADAPAATVSFRQGENRYVLCADTIIEQASPNANNSAATVLTSDGSPLSQTLIRFDGLIGPNPGQLPPGATVLSAKLLLLTGSVSGDSTVNSMSLHRMLTSWSATSTWNSLVAGVSTNNTEAAATADFTLLPNTLDTWSIFDVTRTLQMWSDAPASNNGWVVIPSGTDGYRWISSDTSLVADRPRLEVTYALPICPQILTPPQGANGCRGGEVTLQVSATGTAPLSYQWRHNGTAISLATQPTLTVTLHSGADSGAYDVVVANACGSITSSAAQLNVCIGDFNCDGGVDGNDIEAFFGAWSSGQNAADVNEDGGIDGADVETFFVAWEDGC